MHTAPASCGVQPRRHRPSRLTVFTTAFVAGAAVAFGVNRMLDVHLAQTRPQVECEPIFVALHSLPQGAPVTVWDVALKDWPRAMLPTSALRARDTFEGMVLRHPLREGQPLLSVQLMPAEGPARSAVLPAEQSFTTPLPATPTTQAATTPESDLWAPAPSAVPQAATAAAARASRTDVEAGSPVSPTPALATDTTDTFVQPQPAGDPPAAAKTDIAASESPTPVADAQPTVTEPAASTEPALAAAPEPANPQPKPAEPDLLGATGPIYAPVPASPPSDLDAPLAGIGRLPSAGMPEHADSAKSVLKPGPAAAPATAPQSPPQSAGRYLVVPERIALQADSSFAPPAVPQSTTTAPGSQASPAAKTTPKPDRPGSQNGAGVQRQGTKRPQPGQGNGRQAAPATSRPLGGMFPNLALGIEALGGTQRKPAAAAQPSSTTR